MQIKGQVQPSISRKNTQKPTLRGETNAQDITSREKGSPTGIDLWQWALDVIKSLQQRIKKFWNIAQQCIHNIYKGLSGVMANHYHIQLVLIILKNMPGAEGVVTSSYKLCLLLGLE